MSTDLGKSTTGEDNSEPRLNIAHKTESYSGQNEYGSGSLGGPGIGNKTSESMSGDDSRTGKILEKAGGLLNNENMVVKGTAKRAAASAEED